MLDIRRGWREGLLALLVFAPLGYLYLVHGGPVPQDPGYHAFADKRSWLGLPHFANIASNGLFLLVGLAGVRLCSRLRAVARLSWTMFFSGVALVFFGSAYYHSAPDDSSLVWDRLPMTLAFAGFFAALLSEQVAPALEKAFLMAAVTAGIASVLVWQQTNDLRLYAWVQFMPLLAIPYVLGVYPARHTHRHYLLYGLVLYALAKGAEHFDTGLYLLTRELVSGHTLKHLLAAGAVYCVYLMLKRRAPLEQP